ncbi:winged helix-turn-helix transcriptional regulator [Leisingera sp. ANG-Vp]|uniref:winged helix-turn-helix transcriptional regulator n=1 Tax=Leisingera sp. ANG-Vp TaxID=1577896 RepID=UPI00057CAEAE|nr:winged helix-turn-helix transcriptional regulator [Leisingera sp. ANG-Vp]KIC21552.1 transcriptional regulator [Leisingera sp. ANG-Vp]
MYIGSLVNITARAWALPILAAMHDGAAGRQAPLLAATGAGRTAFAQSMDHLIAMGLVQRNPGYGHPLRPEFRLTSAGAGAARFACLVQGVVPDGDRDLLRRSWTLPVLAALQAPGHFNGIKRSLGTITDRALSHSLQHMENRNWVQRDVDSALRPPRPLYCAINAGGRISRLAAAEITFAE